MNDIAANIFQRRVDCTEKETASEKISRRLCFSITYYCNCKEDFIIFIYLPPVRFLCVEGCWDRTQDCCGFGIDSQTLYTTRLDFILKVL
jgi:hypothetical protein